MKMTKFLAAGLMTVFLSAGLVQNVKAVGVSNLEAATLDTQPINSFYWEAASFKTGSGSFTLSDITVQLSAFTGTPVSGFFVAIYSDSGVGLEALGPDSILVNGLLSTATDPTEAGEHVFSSLSGNVALAGNTNYWVVMGATSVDDDSQGYNWDFPDVLPSGDVYTGDPGWTISNDFAYSNNGGTSWTKETDGGSYKFSVSATAVPEPSTYALLFLGLSVVVWQVRRKRALAVAER